MATLATTAPAAPSGVDVTSLMTQQPMREPACPVVLESVSPPSPRSSSSWWIYKHTSKRKCVCVVMYACSATEPCR